MRILVTGASGFLGHHLVTFLEKRHEVIACRNSHPVEFSTAVTEPLDITDAARCLAVVEKYQPEAVVHAAAMTLTGDCERAPEQAHRVNVEGTRNILMALAACAGDAPSERSAPSAPHLVYLSTDLVFDGQKPGGRYRENDETAPPNPLMEYGRTKREAELLIQDCAPRTGQTATILRSALIYGPPTGPSSCFLEWMIEGIRKGEGALFHDEYRSPVYVTDLCALIEQACTSKKNGIYHAGGPDRISRYDFGLLVARTFDLPAENVRGASAQEIVTSSPRPADVSMDITKAGAELGYRPRPCREGLADIRQRGHDLQSVQAR